MRRFLTGFVVAAVTAVVPVLALAGNQEVAEQIARNLRNSGQMSDYKVGVKFQDGTVWLRGHVSSQEQMQTALALVHQTPGVTRVVNELSAGTSQPSQPMSSSSQLAANDADNDGSSPAPSRDNPLRSRSAAPAAERVQPQQLSLAKRMEAIVSRGSVQQASRPLPIGESTLARADRVPNSFAGSAVEPVSAEESPEAPQPIETPQRAKPMSRAARGTTQVAMMQQGTRGPAAPDGGPMPMYTASARSGVAPARYDQPCLPNYAWPSYAAYPNYAGVTYPKQYSPTAWPYIGPFYPYPQVPLGWRKVTLEWDSGWWFLDFKDQPASCWHR